MMGGQLGGSREFRTSDSQRRGVKNTELMAQRAIVRTREYFGEYGPRNRDQMPKKRLDFGTYTRERGGGLVYYVVRTIFAVAVTQA